MNITYDDFLKLELRVGTIQEVLEHPNADRLYVIKVSLGDRETQVVAGIKRGYAKEELIGKAVVLLENLEPKMLRGVESRGMILAASTEDSIALLTLDRPIAPGSIIK